MTHRLAVLKRALASSGIRRVEIAFLGFGIAEFGVWVAVLVYAFQRGGTTASALIAALQLLPAALVAPLAARLIEIRGAPTVLLGGYLAQAASIAATAVLLAGGAPAAFVYAGAVFKNEAASARCNGTAPIPASSGKTVRYRLNRGGDRQANNAFHTIAIIRAKHQPETRAYLDRRIQEGKTKRRGGGIARRRCGA